MLVRVPEKARSRAMVVDAMRRALMPQMSHAAASITRIKLLVLILRPRACKSKLGRFKKALCTYSPNDAKQR